MNATLMLRSAFLLLLVSGCQDDSAERQDRPASQRERDSVIGASQLPGARGVSGALRASDSAAARRAREDSVAVAP